MWKEESGISHAVTSVRDQTVILITGKFWKLRIHYWNVRLTPQIYTTENNLPPVIILPAEVVQGMEPKELEFLIYREVCLYLDAKDPLHPTVEEYCDADVAAIVGCKVDPSIMHEIYDKMKVTLDNFCGCLFRLWALRGERKLLPIREEHVKEYFAERF